MKKRGVSPVIATVLLVLIVIVLAALIYAFFVGFIKERGQKFNEDADQVCDKLQFTADASSVSGNIEIDFVNSGNVAIYGILVKKSGEGSTETTTIEGADFGLSAGDSKTVDAGSGDGIDNIDVVPILLLDSGKTYPCKDNVGLKIEL